MIATKVVDINRMRDVSPFASRRMSRSSSTDKTRAHIIGRHLQGLHPFKTGQVD
jgi:hypothetical protein